MKHQADASVSGSSSVEFNAKVKRGEKSWNYIYIVLAFALSIEGTIVQMITPICWPWNVIVYVCVMAGTTCLFLLNGRFQNWLIGLKTTYEDKAR